MKNSPRCFFAAQAWVNGGWARDVVLTVDAAGRWSGIRVAAALADQAGATVLDGPVLPGLVNAHSHAFQRAMAGLTERIGGTGAALNDDFWSWRERMYSVACRITPDQMEAIAAFLYAELLAGGYTQVCEFHYVHNAQDGQAYADPLEMSLALVRAAQRVGIGLTLLPTLYMRSGFGSNRLQENQRRFTSTPESVLRLVEGVRAQASAVAHLNVGLAVHSLRAADEAAIQEVTADVAKDGIPLHIHIAEQVQEVQDCLAHTGQRPIEWLLAHLPVNAHWNFVHATQASAAELKAVCKSAGAIVICPSTEANLGDGVFNFSDYANNAGNWSIGSDSHVTRSWSEELRLLEYSQRLTQRRRNVAAQTGGRGSCAAALFEGALAGAHAATGLSLGAIALGQRADFLVLDAQAPALLGVPAEQVLDALVFSSPAASYRQVFVAGDQVLAGEQICDVHAKSDLWPKLAQDFVRTMQSLWA